MKIDCALDPDLVAVELKMMMMGVVEVVVWASRAQKNSKAVLLLLLAPESEPEKPVVLVRWPVAGTVSA